MKDRAIFSKTNVKYVGEAAVVLNKCLQEIVLKR